MENGNGFRTGLGLGNQKDQYLIDKISCIIYISVVIEVIGTDEIYIMQDILSIRY